MSSEDAESDSLDSVGVRNDGLHVVRRCLGGPCRPLLSSLGAVKLLESIVRRRGRGRGRFFVVEAVGAAAAAAVAAVAAIAIGGGGGGTRVARLAAISTRECRTTARRKQSLPVAYAA